MVQTIDMYRQYLGATAALQRFGDMVQIERVSTGMVSGEYWRRSLEKELDRGETPRLYNFGEVQVYLLFEKDWEKPEAEREAEVQRAREDFILEALRRFPDLTVARYAGQSVLYWEPLEGVGVTVNVGQALCERVQVGEEIEEVPDPEALEEALQTIPTVKKVTPKYEWRCNDRELETL